MESFTYMPLDLQESNFRLLRLIGSHPCPAIHCELLEATFGEEYGGLPYEALSYTWGVSGEPAEIFVNSQVLHVTWNLYEALYHLRLSEDRYLWVDAICIDQSNFEERGHQVGLMSTIYWKANSVLVWLGCSTDETNSLFHHMAQFDGTGSENSGLYSLGYLDTLLLRPWFSRVWILQEIGTARAATIVCGWKCITARKFAKIAKAHARDSGTSGTESERRANAVIDLMPGQSFRSETRPTLHQLLKKFSNSEAIEPRDRIYALMSLSCDAANGSTLRPDYMKDNEEVISEVISFLISPSRTYDDLQAHRGWTWRSFMKAMDDDKRKLEFDSAIEAARVKVQALHDVVSPSISRLGRRIVLSAQFLIHQGHQRPFVVVLQNAFAQNGYLTNVLQEGLEGTNLLRQATICSSQPVIELRFHHGSSDIFHSPQEGGTENRFSVTQLELNLYPVSLSNGDIGGQLEEWGHLYMERELAQRIVRFVHPGHFQLKMSVRISDKNAGDIIDDRFVWVTLVWNDAAIEPLVHHDEQCVRCIWNLSYDDMVLKEREQQMKFDVLNM